MWVWTPSTSYSLKLGSDTPLASQAAYTQQLYPAASRYSNRAHLKVWQYSLPQGIAIQLGLTTKGHRSEKHALVI